MQPGPDAREAGNRVGAAGKSGQPWIRENVSLRALIACGVSILGGLVIFVGVGGTDRWGRLLEGVGIALVTTGLVALIYEVALRRSVTAEAFSIANLSRELADTGVIEISQFNRIPWTDFFEQHGGHVEIFVSYALSYARERAGFILAEAAKKEQSVTVILLDPGGPDHLLATYAAVFETDAAELKKRISDVMKEWQTQAEKNNITVSFELIRTVLPFTYYRVGEYMWLVLAVLGESRTGQVPAIYCHSRHPERGLFNWVIRDVETARSQGRIIRQGA